MKAAQEPRAGAANAPLVNELDDKHAAATHVPLFANASRLIVRSTSAGDFYFLSRSQLPPVVDLFRSCSPASLGIFHGFVLPESGP